MKTVAIASGKGGSGKTSLAVSLLLANADRATLLDCDVEEPNCHLFLPGKKVQTKAHQSWIPELNSNLCTQCGLCVSACQFNAIAKAGKAGILIFEELCHSCGGCTQICPTHAISEKAIPTGTLTLTQTEAGPFLVTGTLDVGHASAPTVIRATKRFTLPASPDFLIIDSPPGCACAFMAATEKADHVLLITEDTPFGLHDLELAIEALSARSQSFHVIVNRVQKDPGDVQKYCQQKEIPILWTLPESRQIAEANALGQTWLHVHPELKQDLRTLLENL